MDRGNATEPTKFDGRGPELLSFYIPGGLPSARDLLDTLVLLETALVWSQIAMATEKSRRTWKLRFKDGATDEEKEAARRENEFWNPVSSNFAESYTGFLSRKYKTMLPGDAVLVDSSYIYASEFSRAIERLLEARPEQRSDLPSFRELVDRFDRHRDAGQFEFHWIRRRHWKFGGEEFSIADFNEWIGEELGRDLLKTIQLNPAGSLEFIFDITAVLALITCQDMPMLKDVVVYAVGVLKSWIGRGAKRPPAPRIDPPRLPPNLIRLICQYNDVDVEWDEKKTKLSLKR